MALQEWDVSVARWPEKKADNLSFPDTQSSKICIFGHLKECSRSVFDGVGCKEAGELEPPEGIYITGGWRMVYIRGKWNFQISVKIWKYKTNQTEK